MSVLFNKIVFANKNNIEVKLAVEAPVGTKIGSPQKVGANSSATIYPNVNNCLSARLSVDDDTHVANQIFAMGKPEEGDYSYLESIDADYLIGDFNGRVQARTN